jgi:hypothetical protein
VCACECKCTHLRRELDLQVALVVRDPQLDQHRVRVADVKTMDVKLHRAVAFEVAIGVVPERRGGPGQNASFFNFSYVCPEPVLVKRSVLSLKIAFKGVFLTRRLRGPSWSWRPSERRSGLARQDRALPLQHSRLHAPTHAHTYAHTHSCMLGQYPSIKTKSSRHTKLTTVAKESSCRQAGRQAREAGGDNAQPEM